MSVFPRVKEGEAGYRHQCAADYSSIKDEFSDARSSIANLIGHGSDESIGWVEKWEIAQSIEELIDAKICSYLNAISDRIEAERERLAT